ncbi:ABC transporter ATP-binding protein [Proteinivorax tanatarense]|uniref:ABC transporter ATP-binding protein n=1 Tax=Proteinivorax tanatarense TaxID=1260629 RepID=A0AAU7VP76_9FIRM
MKTIKAENISKKYVMGSTDVFALRNVSVEVGEGDFTCLLGPSGSGKSTLLYLLGGLDLPSKGKVVIGQDEISNFSQNELNFFRRKNVGFIFQSFNLLSHYNALENVEIPLFFARWSKKERREKAAEMLKLVGLGERMKHKPSELSGGQQQRVSIARALIADPDIILADEPTGNLDSKTGKEIIDLLVKMSAEYNKTVIMATHDIEIAEYADNIITLKDGVIESNKARRKFSCMF